MKKVTSLILVTIVLAITLIGCSKKVPDRPLIDLYKAIELGNIEQAKSNLYYKTLPIDGTSAKIPPIIWAIYQEKLQRKRAGEYSQVHNDILRILLDNGADPNAEWTWDVAISKDSALEYSISYENLSAVKILLNKGVKISAYAMKEAKRRGNELILRLLEDAEYRRQLKTAKRIKISASFKAFPDGSPILNGFKEIKARGVDKNPLYKRAKSMRFLGDGAYMIASFEIKKVPLNAELRVVHLSSLSTNPQKEGWSPITISINGKTVVAEHSPSSHNSYMTESWNVESLLRKGKNSIKFYLDNSQTPYWLQSFEIIGQ